MKQKETYVQIKSRLQREFDSLPIKHCGFCAAGDKACAEAGMKDFAKQWGYDDMAEFYKNVTHIGYGLFIRKTDMHLLYEWIERRENEMTEFYASDENVIDALEYEFGNHECQIGGDWEDALNATGLTREECVRGGRDLFKEAKTKFWNEAVKNDAF